MRIIKVAYFKDYKLKLLFADKTTKIADIEPIINKSKGLFHPLKDIEYFKKVTLDDDEFPLSICWPDGEDLCPNVLYKIGKDVPNQKNQIQPQIRKRREGRKTLQYSASAYKVKKQKEK